MGLIMYRNARLKRFFDQLREIWYPSDNRSIQQDFLLQPPCTETEVPSNMKSRKRQLGIVQKAKKVTKQWRKQTPVLPDELIFKIVARMGFPSVFKARLLSRAWYFRFPVPGTPVRCSSMALQNEVMSVSSQWTSYSPVFFGKREILGFDRAFGGWKRLPLSLSSLLPNVDWSSMDLVRFAGSLICAIFTEYPEDCEVFVANVINETWTKLSLSSRHIRDVAKWPDYVRIFPMDSDSYQVLLLYKSWTTDDERDRGSCMVSHLYDSNLRTWSSIMSESINPIIGEFCFSSAYLHGKLYCMCWGADNQGQLWVHLVTDSHHFTDSDTDTNPSNAWIAIPYPLTAGELLDGGVLLCGDNVMVVMWGPDPVEDPTGEPAGEREGQEALVKRSHVFYTSKNTIRIFQLDVNSLQLVEVCEGPPCTMFGAGLLECAVGSWHQRIKFASDADYIYFGQTIPGIPVMTFSVHDHKWGFLPSPSHTLGSTFYDFTTDDFTTMEQCPFTPGLNPFAIVYKA